MHGVVTLLPEPHYSQVLQLWDELETQFGLNGIRVTPYPHFSWQIGEEYDQEALQQALSGLAAMLQPFTVNTTGLGLFTGAAPVIFLPVVKNAELVRVHQLVWDALLPLTKGCSPYYSPQMWVPHISIAYADVTSENIGPVSQTLAFRTFNWQFAVDNFSFILEPTGTIGKLVFSMKMAG